MSFAHAIFTVGPFASRAAAAAGRFLFQAAAHRAANEVIEATIGFAGDAYDFWAGASEEQIRASSPTAIAESFAVITPSNPQPGTVRDDSLADRLLTAIMSTDDGARVLAEVINDRTRDFTFPELLADRITSSNRVVGCALGELQSENGIFNRNRFEGGSAPANYIRRCFRRSTDPSRVSREPHEYEYCVRSGQFARILRLAVDWAEGLGNGSISTEPYSTTYVSLVANALSGLRANGASVDGSDYTFGNFVDMPRTRKAIGRYRQVQRIARSANVKRILELLGLTQNNFIQQLEDRGRWLDVLEEMANQRVQSGSQQTGNVDAIDQFDNTPGQND